MSKAKELATKLIDLYSRSKIWDMNIDSDISDMVYLAKDLANTVLSEPEPLRGWIEVRGTFGNKVLLHLATGNCLREVGEEDSSCNTIYGRAGNLTCMDDSYDEIKQKIKEAS